MAQEKEGSKGELKEEEESRCLAINQSKSRSKGSKVVKFLL